MKKQLWISILVPLLISTITLLFTTFYYKSKINNKISDVHSQECKVYSHGSESTEIKISNGIIVISPNMQIINGGEISYISKKNNIINFYSKDIYIDKHGKKDVIFSNSSSFSGNSISDELSLNKTVGAISSEKLFSDETLNALKDNLYFSLYYTKANGEEGNFTVKLKVSEIK